MSHYRYQNYVQRREQGVNPSGNFVFPNEDIGVDHTAVRARQIHPELGLVPRPGMLQVEHAEHRKG